MAEKPQASLGTKMNVKLSFLGLNLTFKCPKRTLKYLWSQNECWSAVMVGETHFISLLVAKILHHMCFVYFFRPSNIPCTPLLQKQHHHRCLISLIIPPEAWDWHSCRPTSSPLHPETPPRLLLNFNRTTLLPAIQDKTYESVNLLPVNWIIWPLQSKLSGLTAALFSALTQQWAHEWKKERAHLKEEPVWQNIALLNLWSRLNP